MRIHAFSGTRFADPASSGGLACPPYDQIDDDLRDRLHRDPYQFAHLIRPIGSDPDSHRAVARLHQRWLTDGVATSDPHPAIYPYVIELAGGGRRLGVCVLVALEDETHDSIRPHEATVPKTVAERLSLLRETRIDLEPILMLAEDAGRLNHLVAEDVEQLAPRVEHRDPQGHLHRLYLQEDPARIATYQDQLDACVGLIADGHHRYTVARRYAAELGQPRGASAAKLAVLCSIESPGLRIDPIHRQLRVPADLDAVDGLVAIHQTLSSRSGAEIAQAVARSPQPALAVGTSTSERFALWQLDPASAPPTMFHHLRHLAVGWLHEAVLPLLGLTPEAATDGTVTYRSDPEILLSDLRSGAATVGFWLPPMTGNDFARAMQGGRLLPPKSTRFLPKVVSGMVWAPHDCEIV